MAWAVGAVLGWGRWRRGGAQGTRLAPQPGQLCYGGSAGGACCYHRLEVSERGENLRPSPELGDALLELQAAVLGVRELAIEAALWGGYPTNLRKKPVHLSSKRYL